MDVWTLIYDGDCQFCRRQVDRLRRRDRRGRIEAVPFQTADLARFGIELPAAEDAMHLVTPTGTVWRGAEAARETFRLLPFARPLVWLFRAPGAMFAAERVYRWVARRRHRFGCDSSVCRRGTVGG
jgi:predicted DCC family thiol-disulfide oxidoreductase YuxK